MSAPQRKNKKSLPLHPSFRKTRDQLLVMLPLCGMSVYLYGLRPLVMFLMAGLLALVCDLVVAGMRGRSFDVTDMSSLCFAITFTLMLPASCSYGILAFGVLVTVLIGKHAFGGWGVAPFHPSAYGFAATAICFSDYIFRYPRPFAKLPLSYAPAVDLFDGPAATLKLGGRPDIPLGDLIFGNFNGPMGATFCVILMASLIFMIAHGEITWHVPFTFIGTCGLWAFLFPRIQTGRLESVLYELVAGTLIFTAVFIAGEPSTSPSTPRAKMVYGAILGVVCMLFSHYGVFQQGGAFAVLLVTPLSSWLSRKLPSKPRVSAPSEEVKRGA